MRLTGLLLLATSTIAFGAELKWPPVTNVTKPWTRWWWLGSIANEKDITAEMEKYAKAGIGGLEITPIYGVKGRETEFRSYLTPAWNQILIHSLREGKRLDMGIDMATGNGWPFGGLWVTPDDAAKNVVHKTYTVKAGERLTEQVQFVQETMVRAIGSRPQIKDIKEPLSANTNLQAMALEQVRFPKPLPLVALMGYSDGGQALDLTKQVSADGKLDWTAPAGAWTLYAVFQGWHGKQVERAGPGGEGDVIDHFSAKALRNYLAKFDEALKGQDIRSMRAYFNDSYEVDDASGESNWTPEFFAEFQKRRGYDLRNHFPAVFGKDTPDKVARVLTDYRETISDLLLERFTIPWGEWAKSKGAVTRNQAHGSPANILDLYAASGIPEQEGTDIVAIKFASSAAHVMGKKLASSESATWLGEHFSSTLGDAKNNLDGYFLGGINHVCYHGTPFSPASEPWPGWMFYASVHFGPTNSFWNDFPILNQYATRVQSFLQAGTAANDVLVYYPVHDAWAVPGRRSLAHFHGPDGTGARAAGQALQTAGFAYDFISDRQLSRSKIASGQVQTEGGAMYRAIVVPEAKYIPLATWQKLLEFSRAGIPLVVHNQLPGSVAGFGGLEQKLKTFQGLNAELKFAAAGETQSATLGRGRVLVAKDLTAGLGQAGVKPESMVKQELQFVRRRMDGGHAYFVSNTGKTAVDGWVAVQAPAKAAGLYDPMTGVFGVAQTRAAQGGGMEVYLQLAPRQSALIQTFDAPPQGTAFAYVKPAGAAQPLSGTWAVSFVAGGPELPAAVKRTDLGSWTAFGGDALKNFSGTARYAITFNKPAGNASAWVLDLGRVADSARVRLNGKEIGGLIEAPFQVRIPASLLQASNTLEVDVSNLMANRVADLDRKGVNYRKFYNINFPARRGENRGPDGLFSAAKWQPRESGLIGPVTLTPVDSPKF